MDNEGIEGGRIRRWRVKEMKEKIEGGEGCWEGGRWEGWMTKEVKKEGLKDDEGGEGGR